MQSTKAYTEQQPRDGDAILHCGHLDQDRPVHWFKYPEAIRFSRPDGSRGEAAWLAVCAPCFARHGLRTPVRGDGTWIGDDPIIERGEES